MSILVTDTGFTQAPDLSEVATLPQIAANTPVVDVASDTQPSDLLDHIDGLTLIRVTFPSFPDGRLYHRGAMAMDGRGGSAWGHGSRLVRPIRNGPPSWV